MPVLLLRAYDNHIFMKSCGCINPLNKRNETRNLFITHKQKGVNPTGIEIKQQSNITDLFSLGYKLIFNMLWFSSFFLYYHYLRLIQTMHSMCRQSKIVNKQRMNLHLFLSFDRFLVELFRFAMCVCVCYKWIFVFLKHYRIN